MNLRVPDVVASAAAACGAGGWLRDLPGLIAELEAEWSVSVGRPFPHASEAFVAEARLADGTPAVLKLLIPQDGAAGRHEITMLRLDGGRGCAGLLRDDAARGALLLERLGPSLFELGRPLADRVRYSRLSNLKELRPGSAGRSEIRILYIFDPRRNAVLLAAADKAGKWEAWYRQAIPLAEQRYEDYLKQEDI